MAQETDTANRLKTTTMRLSRRFRHNESMSWLISRLLAAYVYFTSLTVRYSVIGIEPALTLIQGQQPFITAFWHGRMFMMPALRRRIGRNLDIRVLVSPSRDGRLIARTMAALGIRTIIGSSSRSGVAALRAMHEAIHEGAVVGITPDGPRGPGMRLKPGVVDIARRMGVPIFLVSYSATSAKIFDSWDRFLLPLPFGRVVFVIKGPIIVPHDADTATLEATRRQIEDALNNATQEADMICGI